MRSTSCFIGFLAIATVGCAGGAKPLRSQSEARGEAPIGQRFEGRASYYSDRLAGRSTASGEPYAPMAFTAASRTLPFGTWLRVRRLDQPRATLVRVNDRGPFGDRRRILDLSRAAAEELQMIRAGVVPIEAEVLAPR